MTAPAAIVVDASVAIKWYVVEPDSAKARAVLAIGRSLIAPDLLVPELGNILWKKVRRGELTSADAQYTLELFLRGTPVALQPSSGLVEEALRIAISTRNTVYDSLYVALALARQGTLITADERLVKSLQVTHMAPSVVSLAAL